MSGCPWCGSDTYRTDQVRRLYWCSACCRGGPLPVPIDDEGPVFVIAGSRREAEYWANANGIPRNRLVYMATEHEVLSRTSGQLGRTFYCVGTWDDRRYRDIAPMMDILRSRGFTCAATP